MHIFNVKSVRDENVFMESLKYLYIIIHISFHLIYKYSRLSINTFLSLTDFTLIVGNQWPN
jgi:hypothetical protein